MQRVLKLSWIVPLLAAAWIMNSGFTPPYRADHKLPVISKPKAEADVFSLRSLKNWGLSNSQARSHINAAEAWKIEEGNRDVVVAVIDTGLDAHHPDLARNVWHDPSKKGASVYGWNYINDRANPSDEHGHGTHVAGIIGAVSNPKTGVSGVAHRVSIMAVKYYSDSNPGPVNLRNTVRALNYAIDHGAKVINYSGGGPEFSEDEYLAMKRAEAKGVLVVSAAGNEHQNTDLTGNAYYPAAYRLSNMISVASTDIHNNLLSSSNWGKQNVDVAAPGENIFSTLPGGKYGSMSGTSQATAFVSGMAALLLSQNPSLKPAQIKELVMGSVDRFPQLANKLVTGGRVNAYQALLAARDWRSSGGSSMASIFSKNISRQPVSLLKVLSNPAVQ